MRYIQTRRREIYIHIKEWRLRERQSNMRLAISWYQWHIVSPEEDIDISYHEIHPEKKWYIYRKMKIERDTIKFEIDNFTILMKYYIARKRRRYFIPWDTSKTAKTIYIYIYIWEWRLRERQTNMILTISWS